MSQTIDSKVVEMKFDNSQFERNVKTSINTLADLNDALKMEGAANGLSDISEAAKKVDLSDISSSIDEIQLKFSTLQVMATTVLANITNSCVNAAKSLVGSVTSMIFEGGWQRSANIEQAEFQLEGLGMDVEEVMANANEAVKGTAYGLDSAAKAAAMFGASGMEAGEQMTSSLRAIAGVASMTGDSYDNIANIFTTVAGNGKLMTIQLRELANRGLNAAATLADYLGVTEAEVRDMVSAGEIDFQTFSDAMDDAFGEHAKDANKTFNGALSNMKAALSRFGADVCTPLRDNLRDVFNGVIPVIDNIHEAAGPVIDGLSDLFSALASKILDVLEIFDGTGMSSLFEYLGNGIEKLVNVINNFDIAAFIEKFKMSDETIKNLQNTLKGLVSFLDLVRQAFGFVVKVAAELISFLAPLGRGIASVTGSFGEWITKIDNMAKENEVFSNATEKVINALEKVKDGLRSFRDRVEEKFNLSSFDELGGAFDKVKEKMSPVTTALKNFKETVGSACKSAWASVKETLSPIIDKFKEFGSNIASTFKNFQANGNGSFMSFLSTLGTVFTNGLAAVIENVGTGISKFITALGNFDFSGITGLLSAVGLSEIWINLGSISKSLGGFFKSFKKDGKEGTGILESLKNILVSYQKEIRATTLIMIAVAIGILAGSLVAISNIEEGKLASSLGGISTLFGELVAATAIVNKINFTTSLKSMSSMVVLAKAIKTLANACVELGQLDWNGIAKGLTGVGGLFAELYAFLYGTNSLVKVSGKGFSSYNMFGLAVSITVLASAIKILQTAVTAFGNMSWNDLAKGLTGVGALLAEIFGFLYGANSLLKVSTKGASSYNMIGLASSIVILAAGIKILQSAVTSLGKLSWNELAKGLTGVTALIAEIIIFLEAVSRLEKTSKSYNLIGVASSIVILAAGIKILQSAVTKLSGLSWNELAKGLSGVGGLLGEIALFLVAVNSLVKVSSEGASSYNLIGVASSIVILASAIKILQSVVIKFSGMSWEEMAKGLLTLAGVLTEVVLALKFMDTSGALKGASAMLVLALAADVFAPSMKILGSLSWESIAKGLIVLAGAFTIMGVAGFALQGLAPIILALSASLLMIGVAADLLAVALVTAGAGLVSISAGLTSFATAMSISSAEIVAGISAIILGIVALVPEIINGIINGVLSVFDTIKNFIIQIVQMIVDVLKETVPVLVDGILDVILEVCTSLAEYAPQIVDALMVLVDGVLTALIDKMPEIIDELKTLVSQIFNGIFEDMDAKGLLEFISSISLVTLAVEAIAKIKINLGSAITNVAKLGILIAELSGILALVGQMTRIPGLENGIDRAADLLEGLGNAIGSFLGGLIGGIATGVADSLPQIGSDLSEFIENLQPFLDGVSQIDSSIFEGISSLAKAILAITAAEVIEGLTSWLTGGSSIVRFGEELAEFGPYFATYADSISEINPDTITASAAAAESLAAFAKAIPNEGGLWSKIAGDNSLEQFGEELASFGPHFAKYANSVRGINPDAVTASAAAAESLAAFAKAIPNEGGLWSKIAGDNSLEQFGIELASFGPHFAKYANSVRGINPDTITASAAAAESLSAFAKTIGNEGGLIAALVGDNSLEQFGIELASFGKHFAKYAEEVDDIDAETITASAAAAESLSAFANTIGNEGGILAVLAGDNSLSLFGIELASFGRHFAKYANQVSGIDTDVVTASASAAESLSAFANSLPTQGGFVEWFTGGQISISDFGKELVKFGRHFKKYANEISGIDSGALDASEAVVDILTALCGIDLPETGGLVGWITGRDVTFDELGKQLSGLGNFISKFVDEVKGISTVENGIEGVGYVIGILDAMMDVDLPETGGFVGWLTGREVTFSELGAQIAGLGYFINSFVGEVSGVTKTEGDGVDATLEILNSMCSFDLPEGNGIIDWLDGNRTLSFSGLGAQLAGLGYFLNTFVTEIDDIEYTDSVDAAINIIRRLCNTKLPEANGLFDWIDGNGTLSFRELGNQLGGLGEGIAEFCTSIKNIPTGNNMEGKINAVCDIMDALCSADIDPGTGGFFGWLQGTTLNQFGNQMSGFASGLCDFANNLKDLNTQYITDAYDSIVFVIAIGDLMQDMPDVSKVGDFSVQLINFGNALVSFCGMDFTAEDLSDKLASISEIVDALTNLSAADFSGAAGFAESLTEIAESGIAAIEGAFADSTERITASADAMMQSFCDGLSAKESDITDTMETLIDAVLKCITAKENEFKTSGSTIMSRMADGVKSVGSTLSSAFVSFVESSVRTIRSYYSSFYSAGSYLVDGFANGISANTYKAKAQASAMASAANAAAQSALKEKSPSKVGFKTGDYYGIGFVNGIANNIKKAFNVGTDLAESSIIGLSSAVSKISDFVNEEMDVNPTITPVLDLSNVKAGFDTMNGLFAQNRSLAFATDNASFIANSMNNRQIQNDSMGDVLKAIKDLNKHMTNLSGDTYNVNGITYDDGSSIADAVGTLVHAAKIGRRA